MSTNKPRPTNKLGDESPGDGGWISAHVFRHRDLDRLLTDAVHPLLCELAERGLAEDAFWLRYWDGGPHLRLRVRLTAPGLAPRARAEIQARCVDYLRQNPAPSNLTEAEYTTIAASLAELEHAGAPLPLQKHDTVRFMPYRREHHIYGDGAAMDAVEEHFVESSSLAMRVLRSRPTARARNSLGFHLIASSWLTAGLGVERSVDAAGRMAAGLIPPRRFAVLARSHAARASRRYRTPSADSHADCRAAWRRCASAVSEHVEGQPVGGVLEAWTGSLTRLRDALVASGETVDVPIVLDAAAHLACNRIGVSFPDELMLRSLAERSMNDATDDAMEART
jgi:thiopeptide-type bacteriocin biosynthesis protein